MSQNQYLLAADNSPALLPLLRETPSLASDQDEHGYSLVHAAASYNHLDLLRTLIREFNVDVNIKDEDGETALFVVETVEAARVLVEELGADTKIRGDEGLTAREKIDSEEEFLEVAEYLRGLEDPGDQTNTPSTAINGVSEGDGSAAGSGAVPPPPQELPVSFQLMNESLANGQEADPELLRTIQNLVESGRLETPAGQDELRQLVSDILSNEGLSETRNVRSRQD